MRGCLCEQQPPPASACPSTCELYLIHPPFRIMSSLSVKSFATAVDVRQPKAQGPRCRPKSVAPPYGRVTNRLAPSLVSVKHSASKGPVGRTEASLLGNAGEPPHRISSRFLFGAEVSATVLVSASRCRLRRRSARRQNRELPVKWCNPRPLR